MVPEAEVKLADLVLWGEASQKANPAIEIIATGTIILLKVFVTLGFIQQNRPT